MKQENYDPIRCIACSIAVRHTREQHDEYLSIWCDEHKSWCGDHTQSSIKEQLSRIRKQKVSLNGLKDEISDHIDSIERALKAGRGGKPDS